MARPDSTVRLIRACAAQHADVHLNPDEVIELAEYIVAVERELADEKAEHAELIEAVSS